MEKRGISLENVYTEYWYDRRRKQVNFSVGVVSKKIERKESAPLVGYLRPLDLKVFKVDYFYSGWFEDSVL